MQADPTSPPLLDLNRASAEALAIATGLRRPLAARIVAHRERHGDFRSVDELADVRGLGPRSIERARPHVAVEEPERFSLEPPPWSEAPVTTRSPTVAAPAQSLAPAPAREDEAPPPGRARGPRPFAFVFGAVAVLSLAIGAIAGVRAVRAEREAVRRFDAGAAELRDVAATHDARLGDVERRAAGVERGLERVNDLATTSDRHSEELAALSGRVFVLGRELERSRARAKILEQRVALQQLREDTTWAWPRPRAEP